MGDEEAATLDGQYYEFCRIFDNKRSGTTITLYRSDFWMRQAKILDDRKVTMTDTGLAFFKYSKSELTFEEWLDFLADLCEIKGLNEEKIKELLTNCGLPGQTPVAVPQFRDYFLTYKPKEKLMGILYCNTTFDGYLCWPPTKAGSVVTQNCPPGRLSDTASQAFRKCSEDGLWVGRRPNETSPVGWTNYTPCFPAEVQQLLSMVYDTDEKKIQSKFDVAVITRRIELVGFSASLLSVTISLLIFMQFRALWNTRTRIHRSLFLALLLQVTVRLILYIDQAYSRSVAEKLGPHVVQGIENMPYLCKTCYIILEYGNSVMFMWMLIEGLHLHQVVTTNSLGGEIPFIYYYLIGWGAPIIFTGVWTALNALYYNQRVTSEACWYGYNFNELYWILQAPRLAVILINLLFLINIIRVLVVKLKHTATSEMERLRKAVRAACVLLPLLGITNILTMVENYASTHQPWVFEVWSYVTHFLRSFQGTFIAIIYCFLNKEVRQVISKHFRNYVAMKSDARRHRRSARDDFMDSSRAHHEKPSYACAARNWVPLKDMRYQSSRIDQASGSQSGVELSEPPLSDGTLLEELKFGYDRRRDPEKNFELVTI